MWYVMQVRTGTEENIRCQCQRLISSNVLERCFIPTEETISGRMAYPGKNPLSRVCLFNCSKSGMSGKWTQKGYRVDETDWNRRSDCPAGAGRSRIAYENRYRQTAC